MPAAFAFLSGGGAVGALIRARDWSTSPLGSPDGWPAELRTLVGIMLGSAQPMFTAWGPEWAMLYNDAYVELLGRKHPAAIGRPFSEVWAEAMVDLQPLFDEVAAGRPVASDDIQLIVDRDGEPSEAHFSFGYTPVRDGSGSVAGLFCACAETTNAVQAERDLQTERDRLRAERDRGRAIRDSIGEGFLLLDFEYRVLEINAEGLRIDGRPEAEIVGRHMLEVWPEAEAMPTWTAYREAMAARKPVELIYRHASDVHDAWLEVRAYPTVDGLAVFYRDVSERRWALDALSESEARFRNVADHAPTMMWVTDASGACTYLNRRWYEFTGQTQEQALGLGWLQATHPDDAAEAERVFLEATAAARAFELEYRLRRVDGVYRWTIDAASPRFGDDGDFLGFVGSVTDVDERREVAVALRESNDRLRLVQQAGGIGSFDWDIKAGVVHRSPEYLEVQGLPPDHPLDNAYGDAWEERLHPDDRDSVLDSLRRTLIEGGAYEQEYRIIRPVDGRTAWILNRGRVDLDATGAAARLVSAQNDITGRKAVEAALRESEARLRLAQEAAGLGSFDWDLRTGRGDLSDTYRTILGFGPDERVDSDALIARTHPADRVKLESELRSIDGGVDAMLSETRVLLPDGTVRWVQSRARTQFDADGKAVRRTGVIQDITERREAEEALRASEARFRAAVRAVEGVVWTNDAEGKMTGEQPGWSALTGQTREQYEGYGWSEVVHPEDAGSTVTAWEAALAARRTFVFEHRVRVRTGNWRRFAIRAIPVLDAAGEITQWVGVHTDVTDQRAAEAALRDLNATLEERVAERTGERDRLWRLSTDMMARADYTGRLLAVSPAWSDVLGWSEQELLTRPYADIIDPEYVDAVTAALTVMRETGQPTRFENRILTADAVWKPVGWTVSPEPGGERFIAVGRDLTQEKARERDLELAQEQLRQSQKMEAVGQLTGGIAHDFNNLLQGITGSLDLLKSRMAQGRTGDVDRLITGATTSATRAAALTHRLLAFSRRQPLDPKPVRANQLVASMEDLLRRTMGERMELELVLAGGLWVTLCDANQLENALLNLAINARDAMPDGGKLTIETCNAHLDSAYAAQQRDVLPGQYVCLCVTDTGTGMTAEVVERAFDPFFTTKPVGEGTGLGLSMIYGFARQSEGYAKIYSEVGQGTTFKLYLPRYRGEAEAEEPPGEPGPEHVSRAGETVLVVEDEAVVRGLVVEVLNDLGYRALEASDGPAGLEVLRSDTRIDLLVTDIGLPGMNGRNMVDAARRVRPDLKVLFMTGYAENAALAGGFLEPGMAMITKPFAMDQLLTRVRDIVEAP